jgi:hypothetical protein
MRRYLATLHKRPEHHQKRFAFLVSGVTTLMIFTIWCFAKFGAPGTETVATAGPEDIGAKAESPLESLRASAETALSSMSEEYKKAKAGLESVDVEGSYANVRNTALENDPLNDTLNTNGQ